jgi:toxin ParE1/3/4
LSRRALSPDAEFDVDEINVYLSQAPVSAAERVMASIQETMHSIMAYPYLGAPHSELTRLLGEEVRSRLVASYRIYYRLGRSGSEIISILHGARDQRNVLTSRFTQ